jgi:hypothetical protein
MKARSIFILAVLSILLLVMVQAVIAVHVQQQKLTASDGAIGDQFGFDIALNPDGTVAVIGAPIKNTSVGAAYVFLRNGTLWTEQQKLSVIPVGTDGGFGAGVAISSDTNTILISAPLEDDAGAGYAYIPNGGSWAQQQRFIPSDGEAGDNFGISVALSADGNTAILGSPFADADVDNQGAAYVFVRNGTLWTQQQKLTADDGADGDSFGIRVDLSADGNTALISAYQDDDNGDDSGSVYVFTRSGTIWTQQQKLTAGDAVQGQTFGVGLDLSEDGSTALIGAPGVNALSPIPGAAYVFIRTGNSWTQQKKLLPGDSANENYFGYSVSLGGGNQYAAIGAPYNAEGGVRRGAAYNFLRTGNDWAQIQKITPDDGADQNLFGAIGMASNAEASVLLIAAMGFNTNRGAVYAFYDPALDKTELVSNGGFEEKIGDTPDLLPWSVKNAVDDKIKCNKPGKVIARTEDCAFQFKGGIGESVKLQQSASTAGITGGTLHLSAYINATNALSTGKVKLVVKYGDATPGDKQQADFTTTVGYTEFPLEMILASTNVSKIKIQIQHTGTAGKVFVDDVSLIYTPGSGLLPLP